MNRRSTAAMPGTGDRNTVKNPDHEAENPGGTPTDTLKGSAPPHPREPEGRQGKTIPKDH